MLRLMYKTLQCKNTLTLSYDHLRKGSFNLRNAQHAIFFSTMYHSLIISAMAATCFY